MSETLKQQLIKEIDDLKQLLGSLAESDEFCYMKETLAGLKQEQEGLMEEFRIRSAFLQILIQSTKKACNSRSQNPITLPSRMEKLTNKFFDDLQKITTRMPRATSLCGQYLDCLNKNGTYFEIQKTVGKDINQVKNKIADNNDKQSRIIESYTKRRREILKLIEEKEKNLGILRQSVQYLKNASPLTVPAPTLGSQPHRRRKVKSQEEAGELPQTSIQSPAQWELRLVFSDGETGEVMPGKRREFVKTLKIRLKKEKIFGINHHSLYDKLISMGKIDLIQRPQVMDKISGEGLCSGWYKLHCGTHRVLLSFDNKARIIRFLPADHGIYQKIWYSF